MRQQPYGRFPSNRRQTIVNECTHTPGDGGGTVETPNGPHKRLWGAVSWDSESYEPRTSGYTFTPEQIKSLPNHDYKATIDFYTKATGTSENTGWWMIAIPYTYGTATTMKTGGFDYTFQFSDIDIDGVSYRVYFLAYPVWSSLSVLVE